MDTRYYTKDIALVRQANINLPNIKLFSSDYLKTTQDKVVKHFHLYTHPEIYKIISNNKHNYLYENYEANDPIKLFIDIDYKINNDSDNTTIDLLINTTIDFLNNILSDYGYINTPIIVLNASTDIKLSSHIIFPRIIFQNVYLIANFFKQINDHENIKIIDTLVYRTGCFRMLNCSKLNKNNALRFYKSYNYQYTTDEQLFMDCLLLNIDPKIKFIDYDLIEPPKIIKQKIKINSIDSSRKNLLLLKPKNDHTFRNLLPNDYLDNYDKWLVVLNVLKNINKFDLFDNWSKRSSNYCQTNNLNLYNNTKNMFININYLIYIININTDYKLTYFKTTKIYESLTYNINKKLGNDKFVSNILTYQDFCNNDNIIIDSDTGTGKTFCISLFFNRYSKEFPDTKIICISALTSLVRQHIKTFNDHGNNMKSYDGHFDLEGAHLTGADLTKANLEGANLERANLIGVNLIGVNLKGANLEGANLEGANLEGANLHGAILQEADFTRAILTNAVLSNAGLSNRALREQAIKGDIKFEGANFAGANFTGAIFYSYDKHI